MATTEISPFDEPPKSKDSRLFYKTNHPILHATQPWESSKKPICKMEDGVVTYESNENRPSQAHLLIVDGPGKFSCNTDCSELTALDTVMTIVHSYNPLLLDKFLEWEKPNAVGLYYFSSEDTKYDLELKIWEKTPDFMPGFRRQASGEPFLEAIYIRGKASSGPTPKTMEEWTPYSFKGTTIGSVYRLIFEEDEAKFVKHAIPLARYGLLIRPCEAKGGARIELYVKRDPTGEKLHMSPRITVDLYISEIDAVETACSWSVLKDRASGN